MTFLLGPEISQAIMASPTYQDEVKQGWGPNHSVSRTEGRRPCSSCHKPRFQTFVPRIPAAPLATTFEQRLRCRSITMTSISEQDEQYIQEQPLETSLHYLRRASKSAGVDTSECWRCLLIELGRQEVLKLKVYDMLLMPTGGTGPAVYCPVFLVFSDTGRSTRLRMFYRLELLRSVIFLRSLYPTKHNTSSISRKVVTGPQS